MAYERGEVYNTRGTARKRAAQKGKKKKVGRPRQKQPETRGEESTKRVNSKLDQTKDPGNNDKIGEIWENVPDIVIRMCTKQKEILMQAIGDMEKELGEIHAFLKGCGV